MNVGAGDKRGPQVAASVGFVRVPVRSLVRGVAAVAVLALAARANRPSGADGRAHPRPDGRGVARARVGRPVRCGIRCGTAGARPRAGRAVGHRVPARRERAGHRARSARLLRVGADGTVHAGRRRGGRGAARGGRAARHRGLARLRLRPCGVTSPTPPPRTTGWCGCAPLRRDGRRGRPAVVVSGIAKARHPQRRAASRSAPTACSTSARATPAAGGRAQDPADLGGKILRADPGRGAGAGQPVAGSPVYSYGHRNVQGLAWDAARAAVRHRVRAEPLGRDQPDHGGRELRLAGVEGVARRPGLHRPAGRWPTDDASPSGLAAAGGALWAAALRGSGCGGCRCGTGHRSAPRTRSSPASTGGCARWRRPRTAALWVTTSNRDGRGEPPGRTTTGSWWSPSPEGGCRYPYRAIALATRLASLRGHAVH